MRRRSELSKIDLATIGADRRVGLLTQNVCFLLLVLGGCNPKSPTSGPEAVCVDACKAAARPCGETACDRGCNLVLDRLVEGEGPRVLACVRAAGACDDRTWARCAVRVGPHADGGPPAPPASSDSEDDDDPVTAP